MNYGGGKENISGIFPFRNLNWKLRYCYHPKHKPNLYSQKNATIRRNLTISEKQSSLKPAMNLRI